MTFAAKGYFDALVRMGELASESQGSKDLGKSSTLWPVFTYSFLNFDDDFSPEAAYHQIIPPIPITFQFAGPHSEREERHLPKEYLTTMITPSSSLRGEVGADYSQRRKRLRGWWIVFSSWLNIEGFFVFCFF